ncbi:MAG: VWA domain-containing protein [Pseudomonadales bacterium]|nr:VWA domain-containing protein [Pseudomonadales bacterium]
MNDSELKRLFDSADEKPPGDLARSRAQNAALDAFDTARLSVGDQGNHDEPRLTPEITEARRKMMVPTQRWIYSGMASAAVVILGVALWVVQRPVAERDAGPLEITLPPQILSSPPPGNDNEQHALMDAKAEDAARSAARAAAESRQAEEIFATVKTAKRAGEDYTSAMFTPSLAAAPQAYDQPTAPYYEVSGRDEFEHVAPNAVRLAQEEPVSTFSVDVDTASYSFVRRQLNRGVLPQKDAVRLEEMVNYFPYDYTAPSDADEPFKANIAVMESPWHPGNKLVHIGIKGYDIAPAEQPRSNLVLLLDVSGSMNSPDKLPLVKQSMNLLLGELRPEDTVAIVVYAGAAGTVLEPTKVSDKAKILSALDGLSAGGSTAGGEGIRAAYRLAKSSFVKDGVNRVILATDGDFNVGITDSEELKGFVERERESGVFLSVLGFGEGNLNDRLMQALAQNGNGIAAYIDTLAEAQKVLVDEATSSLFPIAKDVKIQVEFNPATVREYRLLGYETRMLNREDFNNDAVDAGDIGAGHTVTAIYEITPAAAKSGLIDPKRYGREATSEQNLHEYGFVKIRYKLPREDASRLISQPIDVDTSSSGVLMREARFAAAVAGFAQLLKGGQYTGSWTMDDAIALAQANRGEDAYGYRAQFIQLIRRAKMAESMASPR